MIKERRNKCLLKRQRVQRSTTGTKSYTQAIAAQHAIAITTTVVEGMHQVVRKVGLLSFLLIGARTTK